MSTSSQFTGARKIASIVNKWSAGGVATTTNQHSVPNCKSYASSSVAANALQTMLSISAGRGALNFVSAYVGNTTSRTVRIKVTIDGTVIFDAATSATTVTNDGMVAIGSYGTNSLLATFQPVEFKSSCLVEIASSVLNDSTNITTLINYETDA